MKQEETIIDSFWHTILRVNPLLYKQHGRVKIDSKVIYTHKVL
jgi:hypothetical protein